jgi:hypothetical protein
MPRKKPFKTVIALTTSLGTLHKVILTGPEPAVREVANLVALGTEARAAGVTREGIEMAQRQALIHMGRSVRAS